MLRRFLLTTFAVFGCLAGIFAIDGGSRLDVFLNTFSVILSLCMYVRIASSP
jgi:hypothetical protein